jgi:GxxExxY protein
MVQYLHSDVTEQIIKAAYKVYNMLGQGFLEKVYENALRIDLSAWGWEVQQQAPIQVLYEGQTVGEYFADLVVANKVIVEIKAVSNLDKIHEVQLVNYLKATTIEVGLLINFGSELQIKRRIFST